MYEFFLSYARDNYSEYLKEFHKDLSETVRMKRGLRKEDAVSFFDQQGIELGAAWDPTLVQALQQSKVMIALGSPLYFKQDYCGREWEFFQRRCAANPLPDGSVPPLLKPVVWVPYDFDKLPPSVAVLQQTLRETTAVHNTKGLWYVLKQKGKLRSAYNDFIETLADDIITAGDKYAVPPLANAPLLESMSSAFAPVPAPIAVQPPGTPSGPKHVRFIFAAAHPATFGAARKPDPYLVAGAGEWKPFFPKDERPVNPLLAQVAARDDLLFSSSEVAFGPNLIADIQDALKRRQIVVSVVDPWTLYWDARQPQPQYSPVLRELDQMMGYHWCVLVPDADAECAPLRDDINKVLRSTFDLHATLYPNPLFYREGIQSAPDLQSAVAEVLIRLKEEITKRAAVERSVAAPLPRQVIQGPFAAG